jgi:type IV pilus assembly protein PilF
MGRPLLLLAAALGLACAHGPSQKERETAEIHYNLGLEALRGARFQEAMKEIDEALALDDVFADAHLARGIALEYGFGKLPEAEREYRKALELRPGFSDAHNDLGQLLAKTGRLDEAIREFDSALANMLYKEPWVARCNKGQALFRMGKKEEGLAEMRACLQQTPRFCAGWRELGRLLLGDGDAKGALDAFGHYTRECDKLPDAWYQTGLALLKGGGAEQARDAFEKCAALGADTPLGDECKRSREQLR